MLETSTPDLFGDVSPIEARGRFDQAFLAWEDSVRRRSPSRRPLDRASSQATYRDLWNVFAHWCTFAQCPALNLDSLTSADLERYLQSREEALLKKRTSRSRAADSERSTVRSSGRKLGHRHEGLTTRYVWRVLHLIDRVLAHQAQTAGSPPNRAARELLESRPEWQHANARARDRLPDHLKPAEAAVLVNFLSRPRTAAGRSAGVRSWQEVRNMAAVALHLGAGLTPAEVRAMEADGVVTDGGRQQGLPWKLRVPALGDARERETPLAAWAGRLLAVWLEVRAGLTDPGPLLFPATRMGRAWSKLGHYKAVRELLESSGLSKEQVQGGAYRLRHTFALRQLRRREPPERVARWLGVVDPDVMTRYLAVVDSSELPV